MSALNNMLSDMLKNAIPAEVIELLSPENIKEIGDKATSFIEEIRERLTKIEETQKNIIERIEENGNRNNN